MVRYNTLLEATTLISQPGGIVGATFACWEKRVPLGTYNVTNPGDITTREVVGLIRKRAWRDKEFKFFKDESGIHGEVAAKTPRSNCVMDSTKLAATGNGADRSA